ncbi:MAG TPA: patatin-like phospholipase family protein, partial [Aggregatilineales bacterium]|nr:patatin-like phospholipase family protein [Aggregatilineales bacterium]
MTIRTLVLSGGGGRGAFHAGVYRYLCEMNKSGVDEAHRDAWIPDIVVGTSIGAVNGAAIAQGITAAELEAFWLSLRETDVQGIPPAMGTMARRVTNWVMKRIIGRTLPVVSDDVAISPSAQESWPYIPATPRPLSKQLIGHFSNILDTGPLRQTLVTRLGLDEKKIAVSDKTLLINATNIRTGEGVIFCNRIVNPRDTDLP